MLRMTKFLIAYLLYGSVQATPTAMAQYQVNSITNYATALDYEYNCIKHFNFYMRNQFGTTLLATKYNNFEKNLVHYFNQKKLTPYLNIDLNHDGVLDKLYYYNTKNTSVTKLVIWLSSTDSFVRYSLNVTTESGYVPYALQSYNDTAFILVKCQIEQGNCSPPCNKTKPWEQYFTYDTIVYQQHNFLSIPCISQSLGIDSLVWYTETGGWSSNSYNGTKKTDTWRTFTILPGGVGLRKFHVKDLVEKEPFIYVQVTKGDLNRDTTNQLLQVAKALCLLPNAYYNELSGRLRDAGS